MARSSTRWARQGLSHIHPRLRWLGATTLLVGSALAAVVVGSAVFAGVDRSAIPIAGSPNSLVSHSALPRQAGQMQPQQEQSNPSHIAAGNEPASTIQDEAALTPDRVVAAFDCARAGHKLPAYKRDPELDAQAKIILQRVVADPSQPLIPHENGYTLTGQLVLDPSYPKLTNCMVGGFDVAQVKDLARSKRIGVALARTTVYEQALYLTIIVGY